jgi:DNA-binding CsgD family transcriptional regulator
MGRRRERSRQRPMARISIPPERTQPASSSNDLGIAALRASRTTRCLEGDAQDSGRAAGLPTAQAAAPTLSPRLRQTLAHLLEGKREKQVAVELGLSPSTVHEFIRALYCRFGVSSRAELLAHFLERRRLDDRGFGTPSRLVLRLARMQRGGRSCGATGPGATRRSGRALSVRDGLVDKARHAELRLQQGTKVW